MRSSSQISCFLLAIVVLRASALSGSRLSASKMRPTRTRARAALHDLLLTSTILDDILLSTSEIVPGTIETQ